MINKILKALIEEDLKIEEVIISVNKKTVVTVSNEFSHIVVTFNETELSVEGFIRKKIDIDLNEIDNIKNTFEKVKVKIEGVWNK